MTNTFRKSDFTNTSDKKFAELKETVYAFASSQFDKAIKLGLPVEQKEQEHENVLKLTDVLFEGFIERVKGINNTMNAMADFANSNDIAVCPELMFKIQAFIDGIAILDYIGSLHNLRVLNRHVTVGDLCKSYQSIIDAALDELAKDNDPDSKFEKIMDMIKEGKPTEEVITAFKEAIPSIETDELCFMIQKIELVQNLKVLLPEQPSSEFKKLDDFMTKTLILCKDELDRRRASN
jgi:hypothetical protein